MDDFSGEKRDDFYKIDDVGEQNSEFQEKSHITKSSESLTDLTTKKNTKSIHLPSVLLGAGIAISCLILGIVLANFITEENSENLSDISIITNTEKQEKIFTAGLFVKNGSTILGNPDAPIMLIEFGDYQCSFCKRHFDQTHDLIMKNYVETNKVKILFKDMIVTPGEDSIHAAHAAHCAQDQSMFWEYHYMLYNNWEGENTGWITLSILKKFAQNIGLDMNEFSKCMSDGKWIELINASGQDARILGITGTPSFFLIVPENEIVKIHGAQPYSTFKQTFDLHLKK